MQVPVLARLLKNPAARHSAVAPELSFIIRGIIFRFTQLAAATNQTAMLDGAAASDPTRQISVI